ncbi:MAG TPA: type II toxin-antitoxin system HicA family toxin [Spirochaetota bacterium]|jgi:predicted RNA binding protein YcfA (HicA-like mRNA interferase family)|nr:MAG: YcfA-like protein [Spirochaetes bacterium ADurb.Bin133]HNZ28149.1 type II toxin-antitoxin system HicA family toxin [Spirochaetota bacterium]HPY87437.1 type II toxin-antitoxin system HicA family toxin [Spirochaetota bacterium]HQB60668.1 type II toxin-antitoxin system HicA family toxin [Spirochaetota bacterium]
MKRKEFVKFLEKNGCVLLRNGSRHDVYLNKSNGKQQPVPRHSEIDNILVNHIKKYLGL